MHATCKSARGNHETAFKVMPTFQWNYMDYLLALRVHRVGTLRSGTNFRVSGKHVSRLKQALYLLGCANKDLG